ncbi:MULTISPECIES: potassium transporter TrkG [Nostocaceae]|uniref:potassium transporter TrkG n=1 Tax=Nostocaceae TaxID=1162 RepID=UPI002B26D808|nr:potassium transporter TrkG [Trichormus variabilis]
MLYTVLSVLLLGLLGMPWWEALNYAMTTISTGGFAITSEGLTVYAPIVQLAAIAIMITGATSFSVHAKLLSQHRLSILWRDPQHRMLWLLLVLEYYCYWNITRLQAH